MAHDTNEDALMRRTRFRPLPDGRVRPLPDVLHQQNRRLRGVLVVVILVLFLAALSLMMLR